MSDVVTSEAPAMIRFRIDGREAAFEDGTTVLEAARALEIEIPTLCFNEAVSAYGACRLCVVEVTTAGRTRLTASCTYPIAEGVEVRTDTDQIRRARRLVVEMLLAKSPDARPLHVVAHALGVETPGRWALGPEDQNDCILCGLCARVCAEIVGAAAIDFAERGTRSAVVPFYHRHTEACIGCATCVTVCPTNYLKVEDLHPREVAHAWDSAAAERRCILCSGWRTVARFHEDPATLLGIGTQVKEAP
jgi:NADH dehydrogenase/NADH:ubiquinone oxidoreductase subunit G